MHEEPSLARYLVFIHSLPFQGGGKARHFRAPEAICFLSVKLLQGTGAPPDITGASVGWEC